MYEFLIFCAGGVVGALAMFGIIVFVLQMPIRRSEIEELERDHEISVKAHAMMQDRLAKMGLLDQGNAGTGNQSAL